MRLRDWTICFLCVLISAGMFFVAGSKLDYINAQRQEMKLISNEPLENAPPSLAFATVAMGAFRGLIVDILWIRADNLKEKGQFFDAKQLADWITVLQPRFASVWEFQAWNMAYNISVAIPATQPEERWQWVRNGYELIRDRGLEINPNSIVLYRQLAWIFQHKMGGVNDDVHKYYKLQFAMQMQNLLGDRPSHVFFKALENAPRNLEDFIKDTNSGAEFINDLKASSEDFAKTENIAAEFLALRANPSIYDPNVFDVMDKYREKRDGPLVKFDTFARSYELRNKWKLDPKLMNECNRLYGPVFGGDPNDPNNRLPLNWQNPDSHAIYWAHKGLEISGGNPETAEELNADRIIMHSLQNLYRHGKLYIYSEPVQVSEKGFDEQGSEKVMTIRKSLYLRPEPMYYDSYNKQTLKVLSKYAGEKAARVFSIENGHRNMLKNAVLSFYQMGNKEKATEIYNLLRKLYPERKELHVSLIDFCQKRLREELEDVGVKDTREIVLTMLSEAYFRFAMGDGEQSAGREQMAKEVYEKYQEKFGDEKVFEGDRLDLPPFERMRFLALLDFVYNQMYPQSMRNVLLNRIEVERPELFKQLQKEGEKYRKEIEQIRSEE